MAKKIRSEQVDGVVSKTDEIGNRNLILGSPNFLMLGSDQGNGGSSVFEGDYVKITFLNNGNVYNNTQIRTSVPRVQGQTYTLSFEVNSEVVSGVYFYASGGYVIPSMVPNTNGNWVKVSHTYIQAGPTSSGATLILFGFQGGIAGKVLKYRNLKLEKGNVSTAWTPSPEDQVSDWNQNNASAFNFIKNKPVLNIANWNTAFGWGNHAGLYVTPSSLNSQLANYATLAGTQTFTGTNTFNQSPVVPDPTLNAHAANRGWAYANLLALYGGTLTGDLKIKYSPSLIQPTHEFKTNQPNGRNDFYLRSDSGNHIFRFTADNNHFLFDIGGGMSASNQTGFPFLQIPAWNSQFRVGYYATQLPTYMSAVAGSSWTGGNMDAGGDMNVGNDVNAGNNLVAGGKTISEDGFVHNGYNDPNKALVSDGSVADLDVDVINSGGTLRVQDYFERFDVNYTFNGIANPHKLVHLVSRQDIYLEDLQPGQRIVMINEDGAVKINIYVDGNWVFQLIYKQKVTFYVEHNLYIHIYDVSDYMYYTP